MILSRMKKKKRENFCFVSFLEKKSGSVNTTSFSWSLIRLSFKLAAGQYIVDRLACVRKR